MLNPYSQMALQDQHKRSFNCPEENDETQSEESQSGHLPTTNTSCNDSFAISRVLESHTFSHQYNPMTPSLTQSSEKCIQHDQLTRPCQQNLFLNPVGTDKRDLGANRGWHYPCRRPGVEQTSSLPSYLPSTDYQTYLGAGSAFPSWHPSHLGTHSLSLNSLEQPGSLHSFLRAGSSISTNQAMLFPAFHCEYNGQAPLQVDPQDHLILRPKYQLPHKLKNCDLLGYTHPGGNKNGVISCRPGQKNPCNTQLSWEQRKVFVTYEVDSEDHLKEIIKFVVLLRNNGFDTHIDVFEEQLYSISKIDCMERYLNEKDYLIIMVISLKYFETVTGAGISVECDERTSNTVYIHKQLQSEFIQNGCRNFRVVPVLFPGAKKSYVPPWLQNTLMYSWPRDRDDILRRLMQVEKYNPPPIGPLPTIVSMPL